MTSQDGPVIVAAAADGVVGAIMAAALESAGIPVEVRGVGPGWLFPGAQTSAGPVEILVPGALVEDARAILASEDGVVADPDAGV